MNGTFFSSKTTYEIVEWVNCVIFFSSIIVIFQTKEYNRKTKQNNNKDTASNIYKEKVYIIEIFDKLNNINEKNLSQILQ